jgi:hypothetical protein
MSFSHAPGGPKVDTTSLTQKEVEENAAQDSKDYEQNSAVQIATSFTPVTIAEADHFSFLVEREDAAYDNKAAQDIKKDDKKDDVKVSGSGFFAVKGNAASAVSAAEQAFYDPDNAYAQSQAFFNPITEKANAAAAVFDPYAESNDPFAAITAEDVAEHLKHTK